MTSKKLKREPEKWFSPLEPEEYKPGENRLIAGDEIEVLLEGPNSTLYAEVRSVNSPTAEITISFAVQGETSPTVVRLYRGSKVRRLDPPRD